MAYTPPVNQADIDKAQARFWRLVAGAGFWFVGLGESWWLYPVFWSGHKIWVSGATLIVLSVIHTKYFDIRRVSNPQNRLYDSINAGRVSALCQVVEGLVKAAWLVGFILMAISRWVQV